MIRRMVGDMERYGGYAATTDQAAWSNLEARVADEIQGTDARYVIAKLDGNDPIGVAGARLVTLGGAFSPMITLHLSVLYVVPKFRNAGIGGRLLDRRGDAPQVRSNAR
jgi:hypothetical protein